MKRSQIISVFISIIAGACRAQVQNANFNPNGMLNRQGAGGISFAIPGLSLLAGGNGVGGNLFGPRTFTRTLVSTVSTVTTASFRTCTTSAMVLMPCAAGRRRRSARLDEYKINEIQATPTIQLIIGSTTISDPGAVTEYLEAHKPSSQSVIYPPGVDFSENDKVKMNPRLEAVIGETTVLYPSQDTPETTASLLESELETFADDFAVTTETPSIQDEYYSSDLGGTTSNPELEVEDEKARVGFGGTTTVTTIIRVTSVATTLATGAMATLTVMYGGCSPPVFPVSGIVCVP